MTFTQRSHFAKINLPQFVSSQIMGHKIQYKMSFTPSFILYVHHQNLLSRFPVEIAQTISTTYSGRSGFRSTQGIQGTTVYSYNTFILNSMANPMIYRGHYKFPYISLYLESPTPPPKLGPPATKLATKLGRWHTLTRAVWSSRSTGDFCSWDSDFFHSCDTTVLKGMISCHILRYLNMWIKDSDTCSAVSKCVSMKMSCFKLAA